MNVQYAHEKWKMSVHSSNCGGKYNRIYKCLVRFIILTTNPIVNKTYILRLRNLSLLSSHRLLHKMSAIQHKIRLVLGQKALTLKR